MQEEEEEEEEEEGVSVNGAVHLAASSSYHLISSDFSFCVSVFVSFESF